MATQTQPDTKLLRAAFAHAASMFIVHSHKDAGELAERHPGVVLVTDDDCGFVPQFQGTPDDAVEIVASAEFADAIASRDSDQWTRSLASILRDYSNRDLCCDCWPVTASDLHTMAKQGVEL